MSIFTVLAGDLVVVIATGIGSVVVRRDRDRVQSSQTGLASWSRLWAIGLLLYGLPTLAFVIGPCTIAWVLLVTWLARRSADNGAR